MAAKRPPLPALPVPEQGIRPSGDGPGFAPLQAGLGGFVQHPGIDAALVEAVRRPLGFLPARAHQLAAGGDEHFQVKLFGGIFHDEGDPFVSRDEGVAQNEFVAKLEERARPNRLGQRETGGIIRPRLLLDPVFRGRPGGVGFFIFGETVGIGHPPVAAARVIARPHPGQLPPGQTPGLGLLPTRKS